MVDGRGWPSKFIYLMKMSKGCVVYFPRGYSEGARAPWCADDAVAVSFVVLWLADPIIFNITSKPTT